ncbi:DUF1398 domain-containing protein [Mycolicibacterium frederiksbergense]|uniref:DUF1398 domain-containing protein n=1 Tax=Mycolicibacterium frederiksbergense TaxID=117567 RepID=UPI00399B51B0
MTMALENLRRAFQAATDVRPEIGGFPYLAETLRRAGVRRNEWLLPSLQRIYHTDAGAVVEQGTPLLYGLAEIPSFDSGALIRALRADQEGRVSFEQFVASAWAAGVMRWAVDLYARTCTYHGSSGETYVENYPAVSIE